MRECRTHGIPHPHRREADPRLRLRYGHARPHTATPGSAQSIGAAQLRSSHIPLPSHSTRHVPCLQSRRQLAASRQIMWQNAPLPQVASSESVPSPTTAQTLPASQRGAHEPSEQPRLQEQSRGHSQPPSHTASHGHPSGQPTVKSGSTTTEQPQRSASGSQRSIPRMVGRQALMVQERSPVSLGSERSPVRTRGLASDRARASGKRQVTASRARLPHHRAIGHHVDRLPGSLGKRDASGMPHVV